MFVCKQLPRSWDRGRDSWGYRKDVHVCRNVNVTGEKPCRDPGDRGGKKQSAIRRWDFHVSGVPKTWKRSQNGPSRSSRGELADFDLSSGAGGVGCGLKQFGALSRIEGPIAVLR